MINLKKYEIIPLGNDCAISHFLRKKNLRKYALPFDWNVTSIATVIELINNDFTDFLDIKNLVASNPTERQLFSEDGGGLAISDDIITPILDRKYKILFPHDFTVNGLNELEAVKTKYQKRIIRLFDILNSKTNKVVFVAANHKLNVWQQEQYTTHEIVFDNGEFTEWKSNLKLVLDKKFPNIEYKLINFNELEHKGYFKQGISMLKSIFNQKQK